MFNPTRQAQRYDPAGDYVRRWVPELGEVEGGAVHEPWKLGLLAPTGYPPPDRRPRRSRGPVPRGSRVSRASASRTASSKGVAGIGTSSWMRSSLRDGGVAQAVDQRSRDGLP